MSVADDIRRRGLSDAGLLELFREAQDELIAIIEGIDETSPFREFRQRQLKAIQRTVLRLEMKSQKWAKSVLPDIVEAGARETYEQIKGFKEQEFGVEFAGVPREAVMALLEFAYLDFGKTMAFLDRNTRRVALEKRALQDKITKGLITGASGGRTSAQLVRELKKQGVTALRARNGFGRKFTMEDWSDIVVRSQTVTAYNMGSKHQMLASGRRFGIFPTIRPDIDGEDVCNEWERKKYVDLTKDPLPPASTHPRCRHVIQPVSFAQLKRERPDLYRLAVPYFNSVAQGA